MVREGENYWSVAASDSLIIVYSRPFFEKDYLAQSVLTAYWLRETEEDGYQRKSEEFIKWSRRVLAWARRFSRGKAMCRGYPVRTTKKVEEAVEAGEIELTW
jgi:hypothetical protein